MRKQVLRELLKRTRLPYLSKSAVPTSVPDYVPFTESSNLIKNCSVLLTDGQAGLPRKGVYANTPFGVKKSNKSGRGFAQGPDYRQHS